MSAVKEAGKAGGEADPYCAPHQRLANAEGFGAPMNDAQVERQHRDNEDIK
jgi:hypothetical protein